MDLVPSEPTTVATEVAIIGAGPTGMYLANRLAALGLRSIVVERRGRGEVSARQRAGLLEHRTVERLARHGLARGLLAHGRPHRGATFRTPHGQIELDMAACCGGKMRMVYPQSRLVDDMIDHALSAGADLRFGHEAMALAEDEDGATVACRTPEGGALRIRCSHVVAADGHTGVGRRLAAARGVRFHRYRFPHHWIAIMADVGPSAPHAIYGIHPRGFAGHMIRTESQTRFYLQIAASDDLADWTEARMWDELELRLAAPGWSLRRGTITSKHRLELRSEIIDSMVHGRSSFVGDAAHLMPPCGGKGMNLGLMDVDDLVEPLAHCVRAEHDPKRLRAWSKARLEDTWATCQFSHAMTELLHNVEARPLDAEFSTRLKARWLEHLTRDHEAGAELSRRYIGI